MKKTMVLLISLIFLIFGCSVKEDDHQNEPPIDIPENAENYLQSTLKDIHIDTDYVELNVDMSAVVGVEYTLFAYQDGLPVLFSLDSAENVALSQRITVEKEEENLKLYMKANSFEKGEQVNFGVGFVSNPNYIPEVIEFTRFDITKQAVSATSMDYQTDKAFHNETTYQSLNNLKWETIHSDDVVDTIAPYMMDSDQDVLKKIVQKEQVNDLEVIHVKSNDLLQLFVMKKGKDTRKGYISFYIDHQPVKINGGYAAAYLDDQKDTFGMTSLEIELPKDVKPGYHTLYAIVFENQSSATLYDFYPTVQRILKVE